jgi:hypothetical protein
MEEQFTLHKIVILWWLSPFGLSVAVLLRHQLVLTVPSHNPAPKLAFLRLHSLAVVLEVRRDELVL